MLSIAFKNRWIYERQVQSRLWLHRQTPLAHDMTRDFLILDPLPAGSSSDRSSRLLLDHVPQAPGREHRKASITQPANSGHNGDN